jgi:hypothetical protein
MAVTVNVAGPVAVSVGTGSANALESLGYTRDGAHITEDAAYIDVPGDQNGGDAGHPIDVQILTTIHRVRLELTKYDTAIAAKLEPRIKGGTQGVPPTAGTLMFAGDKCWRLLLNCTTGPRNYLKAFLRNAIELNKGTRFSTLVLEFECHPEGGYVWNTTTS